MFHLRRPVLAGARRRAARAGDPRPAGRGARARSPRPTWRRCGRPPSRAGRAFAEAFFAATAANPTLGALAPVVLYRTLGPTLPDGAAAAAILWGAAHRCAHADPGRPCARAGFDGRGPRGRRAAVRRHPGQPVGRPLHRRRVRRQLAAGAHRGRPRPARHPRAARRAGRAGTSRPAATRPGRSCCRPGERRSFTANTIIRDPTWRKRDADGRAAGQPGRRRAARRRRRRAGPAHDEAGPASRSLVEVSRRHAARPRLAAQRPRARLPRARTGSSPRAWRRTS